jgi:hypothetical protein
MDPMEGAVRRGEVLTLVQRSVRRRDYALRRGDRDVGGLRFPPGRRAVAQAEAEGTGSLALTASRGGVEVRGGAGGGVIVASVERTGRGGARLIRTGGSTTTGWRRTGWHRWAIRSGDGDLLGFTVVQGLLRSSVRVTAHQDLPEPDGMLFCLIGGFLALRELQAEVDGSASVGGIVASGAG